MSDLPALSRREREVMDIIHELHEATASQLQERMANPPSNSAIRSILRVLVNKEHLAVSQQGPRYVYSPTEPREQVQRSAMKHLLHTFFGGSVQGAIAALLELEDTELSKQEQARLKKMIDQAAREGR